MTVSQSDLVGEDGYLKHARPGDRNFADTKEIWPAGYGAAYAKWKGRYENIGQGNHPGVAMQELTGPSQTIRMGAAS